jgi:hypothetical protein
MKRTVNILKTSVALVIFIIASFSTVKAQELALVEKAAVIEFESQTIDYGQVAQNSNGERTFYFKNTGNAPLVLTNVKSSCGCTVPSYSKEPIMPGKEGEIDVKYDTKKIGAFTKTITVSSNAKEEKVTLKIKGEIVGSK